MRKTIPSDNIKMEEGKGALCRLSNEMFYENLNYPKK